METSRNREVSNNAMAHGVKRAATDGLEHEQRLSKRFDLLNLDHHRKRYIPVNPHDSSHEQPTSPLPPKPRIAPIPDGDVMQLENTAHKVYIYDLDKELAEIESDEENPVFLSDIEKHLSKIPRHLLQDRKELRPTDKNQLVLYTVPSSLTVPAEQDSVKKAIMEARARVKERQALNPNDFTSKNGMVSNGSPLAERDDRSTNGFTYANDPDAMDIEEEL